MERVVAFGNCQMEALARLLRIGLPAQRYSVEFLSNNPRTGGMQAPEAILERVAAAGVLLYQPLRERHGAIAEDGVRAAARGAVVTVPYLFNSGMAAMCHAPGGRGAAYGTIFGDEPVIAMLDAGAAEAEIAAAYEGGEIDFRLSDRFAACMAELERRESRTDVRVAGSILASYRSRKQFLAHNHPTVALLGEVCAQVEQLAGLPIDLEAVAAAGDELLRGGHRCPISPHDARALGYEFAPTPDWLELGTGLIATICAARNAGDGGVQASASASAARSSNT